MGQLTTGALRALLAVLVAAAACGAVAQQRVVKVAYVGPLTGANTAMGIGTRNSMELALRHANERGKLPYRFELVSETDDSKPSTGVAAVQKICNDPTVVAASAHWNSPVALATMKNFEDCGMLNVIAGAALDELTQKGIKEIGRVSTPFGYLLPVLARGLTESFKVKTLVIIKSRDAFGEAGATGFIPQFEKLGGKVLAVEGYNLGERDFTATLTKVRGLNPDAVYLSGTTTEAALVVRQMRQLRMNALFVGHAGWQTSTFVEAAGPAGEGAVVVTSLPFIQDLPGGPAYQKGYAAAGYKEPHEAYGPFGYAAGQLIVELVRRFGPDRKAMAEGLRQLRDVETIFGKVSVDANGEMQPKYVGLAELRKGSWEKVGKVP